MFAVSLVDNRECVERMEVIENEATKKTASSEEKTNDKKKMDDPVEE